MDGGFLASLAFVGLAIAWVAFSLWCATHSPPAEPRRAELQQDRYIGEEPIELPQEVPPSVFPPPGPEADAAAEAVASVDHEPGAAVAEVADAGPATSPTAIVRAGPLVLVRRPPPPTLVFLHGFAGFDELPGRQAYFRGVRAHLARRGVRAHFIRVPAVAPVSVRAAELARALDELDAERVHLVAHSMGGLDARYAIARLGQDARIATLVTVATPHRGTPLAAIGARFLRPLASGLPMSVGAVADLTPDHMAAMNDAIRDSRSVRYASVLVAPRNGALGVVPLLWPTHAFISKRAGENDGIVPVSSQAWGTVLGRIDTDHWGAVGWSLTFDAPTFYERVAERLLRAA